jgi:predicted Abi (CAAX) family protease
MEKTSLWSHGKRLAEIESLTVSVKMMKSVRKLVTVYYLSIVTFILLTAGVFIVVVQALSQYQNTRAIYLDPILGFGAALAIGCTIASLWLLSERRWIAAFHLDSLIENAIGESRPTHEALGELRPTDA